MVTYTIFPLHSVQKERGNQSWPEYMMLLSGIQHKKVIVFQTMSLYESRSQHLHTQRFN